MALMEEKMTKEELRAKLQEIATRGNKDPEVNHEDADKALLQYINDEGIRELFWYEIKKWYA